jgi:hypothetical protein
MDPLLGVLIGGFLALATQVTTQLYMGSEGRVAQAS